MSKHIYTLLENRHFYRKNFRLQFVYFLFLFRMLNTEALWFCTVMALWNSVTLGWKNTKSPVIRESVRESLINTTNRIAVMSIWYNRKGGLVLLVEKFKYYLFYGEKSLSVNCVAFVRSADCRKHCWFLKSEISACSGDSWLRQVGKCWTGCYHCHLWSSNCCVSTFLLLQQLCCYLQLATLSFGRLRIPSPLGRWTALDSLFFYICAPAVVPTSPHPEVRGVYWLISLI